jgi:hypothetical protein
MERTLGYYENPEFLKATKKILQYLAKQKRYQNNNRRRRYSEHSRKTKTKQRILSRINRRGSKPNTNGRKTTSGNTSTHRKSKK